MIYDIEWYDMNIFWYIFDKSNVTPVKYALLY